MKRNRLIASHALEPVPRRQTPSSPPRLFTSITGASFAWILLAGMLLASSIYGCVDPGPSKEIIYVGTFEGRDSEGIYVYEFDRKTGELTHIQTVTDRISPNFQTIHPNGQLLYSVSREAFTDESESQTIGAYRIDRESGRLELINERPVGGVSPTYVSVDPDGRLAFVSHYITGNLSVFRITEDGSLDGPTEVVQHEGSSIHPQRQQRPHAHSIVPSADGRFVYVQDLGIDRINIYETDYENARLIPANVLAFESTPGAGPRHFVFHPDGEFAYLAEELTSTVSVLQVDRRSGRLEQIQRESLLPDDFEGANSAADIHVSPDGRFLYASNRGHDSLAIYSINQTTGRITLEGHESTRGGHPRDFMIDKYGEFVLVANRDDDNVVVFRRDKSTGMLEYTGRQVHVPMAVCVTQLILD